MQSSPTILAHVCMQFTSVSKLLPLLHPVYVKIPHSRVSCLKYQRFSGASLQFLLGGFCTQNAVKEKFDKTTSINYRDTYEAFRKYRFRMVCFSFRTFYALLTPSHSRDDLSQKFPLHRSLSNRFHPHLRRRRRRCIFCFSKSICCTI